MPDWVRAGLGCMTNIPSWWCVVLRRAARRRVAGVPCQLKLSWAFLFVGGGKFAILLYAGFGKDPSGDATVHDLLSFSALVVYGGIIRRRIF